MKASILLLPGDGIGPEVVAGAAAVLRAVASRYGHEFDLREGIIGGAALRRNLPPLPNETLAAARESKGILLGAVGDPAFDRGDSSRRPETALLAVRRELQLYANFRPAKVWPGLEGSGPLKQEVLAGTDMLVLRELTGGSTTANRGASLRTGRPPTTRCATRVTRLNGSPAAASRRRGSAASASPRSTRPTCSRPRALWRQVVTALAAEYPDVALDHMYVDSCAMKIALAPSSFDVILTENLFGDILSDEAGAIVGSLGLLPSASVGDGPGLFEPVHGSAPDIAGRNIANPIGAIASAAMLLRQALQLDTEARAVEDAIGATLRKGLRTADLAEPSDQKVGTAEMADAIAAALLEQPAATR